MTDDNSEPIDNTSPDQDRSILPESDPTTDHDQKKRRSPLPILVAALVVILAIGSFLYFGSGSGEHKVTHSPSPSSTASATPTVAPTAASCPEFKNEFVPTKLTIAELGVNSPVLSLGRDKDDAAAAPPKDQPTTAGWFNEGPKAGSAHGKVLLTIHTYHKGGALGNDLLDKWKPGMTLKLSDNAGNEACYTTGKSIKFRAADYDHRSKIIYDWESPTPQVAIVVCDDYDKANEEWLSRVVFYADAAIHGGNKKG